MVAKVFLFVCAQAVVMQSISGQCIGANVAAPWAAPVPAAPWAAAPCAAAAPWAPYATATFAPGAAAASNGGALAVTSGSAMPLSGVSVASENAYGGELAVRGALPFLGTVGLEGALPTIGAGAVAYGCGNGEVAMLTEDIAAAGFAGPFGYGGALGPISYRGDGLGYGIGAIGYEAAVAAPIARAGCGCGRAYV